MLTEKQINGDNCLIYAIGDNEAIQTFHLGMLTTNRQLPAVPLSCQYVDGRESLILPLHELIPIIAMINSKKGPRLEQLLQLLGRSIQTLMAYQLKPENIVLDERHIYIDSNYQTLYLVYLPLKENYNEPKTALSNLLLNWMDHYMNGQGALAHPLFIQLLLKLRQESCSFRTLIELLTKNDWQQTEMHVHDEQPPIPLIVERPQVSKPFEIKTPESKATKMGSVQNEYKKDKQKLNLDLNIKGLPSWYWAPVPIAILLSAGIGIVAPVSPSSKLGVCMVVMAISVYIALKLKEKFGSVLAVKKENKQQPRQEMSQTTNYSKSSNAFRQPNVEEEWLAETPVPLTPPPLVSPPWQTGSEETVLLSDQAAKAVLMVRGDEGPRYYSIQKDVVTIGRNPSVCDLVMDETGIGRMHAEVHHNQGQYYIKDNQSLNGTYVNGKRITSNQYFQLKSGDLIKIAHREVVFS